TVGPERVVAVSSDNAGNTKVAREIIVETFPWILNLPDPIHHLNLMLKDIAALRYFRPTIKRLRGVIKYFKKSGHGKVMLQKLRLEKELGPGLESIGKTRFGTLTWSAISLRRSLPAIRELCTSEKVTIPVSYLFSFVIHLLNFVVDQQKWHNLFLSNTPETLQFELALGQFISVTEGGAKAIECLEATATNPADVFLYWLAVLAQIKSALVACCLPDDICGQIRGIVNSRYREFFVDGPTNVHLSAFYLNPSK
ncbi:hypothetical protein BDN70DRAFT_821584, partial [Pholiota conissans]